MKKFFALLLFFMPAAIVCGQTIVGSGTCGATDNEQNVTWKLTDDGVLTISGTGEMMSTTNQTSFPWYSHADKIKTVVVENGVTNIGQRAFMGFYENIIAVSIPETVTAIGQYAFYECISLTEVSFPSKLESIARSAFCACTSLKEVKIPSTVTLIGTSAFERCTSLTAINVEEGNPYYHSVDGVLIYRTTLLQYPAGKADESYVTPSGVSAIAQYSFYGCTKLKELTFSISVERIDQSACNSATSLTKVNIPSSVKTIDDDVFSRCASLTEINVDADNPNYSSDNGVLFNKEKTTLIKYPLGRTDESYVIPSGVTYIEEDAFRYCNGLGEITMPASVTNIGNYAFPDCSGLTKVTILGNLTNIGYYAFSGCYNLTEMTILATDPPSVATGAFTGVNQNLTVSVPSSSLNAYQTSGLGGLNLVGVNMGNCSAADGVSSVTWKFTDDGTLTISGTGAMADYDYGEVRPWQSFADDITKVVIEDGVTRIGKTAFRMNFNNLIQVVIPESVTSIGDQAFAYSNSLKEVTFPSSVNTIGSDLFYDCPSLTAINVAEDNADFSSEAGVLFNKNKTELIRYPEAKKDDSYVIPNTVAVIYTSSFSACYNLTQVTIPESISNIGNNAFANSNNLAKVTMFATTVPSIEHSIFNSTSADLVIYVPYSKVGEYQSAEYLKGYAGRIKGLTASVTTAPAAVANLVANGSDQNLVTAGVAENGTMVYSLDGGAYSDNIPTGKEAKEYTVSYKAQGDGTIYGDSEETNVKVTIKAATAVDETSAVYVYALDGRIYCDAETYTIYNTAGQNVTAQNGNLKGMYIVVVEGSVVKVRVN